MEAFLSTRGVALSSSGTWAAFPTDCADQFLNSGIMIWNNSPVTRRFLLTWYQASKHLGVPCPTQTTLSGWIQRNPGAGFLSGSTAFKMRLRSTPSRNGTAFERLRFDASASSCVRFVFGTQAKGDDRRGAHRGQGDADPARTRFLA